MGLIVSDPDHRLSVLPYLSYLCLFFVKMVDKNGDASIHL